MNSGFEALSWDLRNENLFKTEALFLARKNDWSALFIEHFLSVCADIVKLQSESSLPAISRIQYTMLNNDFIDRRYVSEVWGSDNAMYLDKKKCMVGEFDISFLFVYFNEMWDKLLSPRKRCKATDQEVVSFMSESLPHFYSYLISIARFAIAECVDKKPFVDIAKEDFFKVNVDDYMSETAETVYMEKKNKNAEDLSKWFSEKINYAYNHGDYSGLDFSGKEFINTDFRYVRFRDSKLNYVNFENSSLIGASFRNAEMEGCRLDNCYIFEADFSNANMKNASLIQTTGKVGSIDKKVWQFVGYLPVNFHNADLTGADFTGAKLTGADFTGAILSGADFTTTVLTGADFTGAILSGADFTTTVLTGADFTGAILSNAKFTVTISSGANFTGANLTGANFTSAVLIDAVFTDAILDGTVFDGCIDMRP